MIKTDKNIRDSYKHYEQQAEDPVDVKTYVKLANNYNKFLMEKVQDGGEVVLPMRMGTLCIVGTKQKIKFDEDGNPMLAPNWKKTKELWLKNPQARKERRKVYHTNDHTGGVRFKYFWSKKRIFATNKNLYHLIMTRHNKRQVPKRLAEGKEYFIKY